MDLSTNTTVLVVDDEEPVREAFTLYLESAGYDVRTAANGGEAVVELDPAVDVVLLDRRMPGMSGNDVLTHVREWHADCRVAMVTAVDPGPDILDMPFDDYLTKPVEKAELLDMVEQLCLFDRYEELIEAYHSVVRKCAVLESHRERSGQEPSELAELESRRETLAAELDETITRFADDAVADVFRRMHPTVERTQPRTDR